MPAILLVDDDPELRETVAEVLAGERFEVRQAAGADDALDLLGREDFDLVLMDLVMPGMDGMAALPLVKGKAPGVKVVIMTAFSSVSSAVQAMRLGADDYITKPFKIEELLAAVRRNLEEARLEDCVEGIDADETFAGLANTLRRGIIIFLDGMGKARFMDITRHLGVEDHTKVSFHLRILREAGLIEQDSDRMYRLSEQGRKVKRCLGPLLGSGGG